MSMKIIKRNVVITLSGRTYLCDVALGMYLTGGRPAIILLDAEESTLEPKEVVAIASTNVPAEYLTGMPQTYFGGKDYSENSGLWDQLETLCWEDTASPLFLRTSKRVTLGHVRVQVYDLGPDVADVYHQLLSDMEERDAKRGR